MPKEFLYFHEFSLCTCGQVNQRPIKRLQFVRRRFLAFLLPEKSGFQKKLKRIFTVFSVFLADLARD